MIGCGVFSWIGYGQNWPRVPGVGGCNPFHFGGNQGLLMGFCGQQEITKDACIPVTFSIR